MDGRVSGTNTTEKPQSGSLLGTPANRSRPAHLRLHVLWPVLVLRVSCRCSSGGVPPVTLQCACNSPEGNFGLFGIKKVWAAGALCCTGAGQSAVPSTFSSPPCQSVPMRCQCAVVCLAHLAPGVRFVHAVGQSEEPSIRGLASQPPEKSGHFPNTLEPPESGRSPELTQSIHSLPIIR